MENVASEIVETILQALESGEDGGKRGLTEYIATTLHAARLDERNKVIQKLLDNAHGGGNWRRIAEQLRSPQTKAE